MDRIKGFAAMNKLKKEALMVIARNLPKEEIEGLKQVGRILSWSSLSGFFIFHHCSALVRMIEI